MKRSRHLLSVFLVLSQIVQTPTSAQVLSEAEVMQLMNKALTLKENGHYKEAYELAGTALSGKLTANEREVLCNLYVTCGYLEALNNMKATGKYAEAREIFDTILPYANSAFSQRIVHYRGVSWYLDGMHRQRGQRYEPALACYSAALLDFCQVGAVDFQMETQCRIGEINKLLSLWQASLSSYLKADRLAKSLNNEDDRMEILCELYQLYNVLGENESIQRINDQLDSLFRVTNSANAKYTYQDFKGEQARRNRQYAMSERWHMQNVPMLGVLNDAVKNHRFYMHMRELYADLENWGEAIRYAFLEKAEKQRGYTPSDAAFYSPYSAIADVYRRKRDSLHCFQYLDSLFCAIPLTLEPRDIQYHYLSRAFAYADFGNYAQALSDYQAADSLLAKKYSIDDGDRVALLPLLGGLETRMKEYEEAERLYRQYASHIKRISGEKSGDYVDALGYLANAEAFAGHMDLATGNYKAATGLLKQQVRVKWPYLTSSEREGYWATSVELLNNMTPFALKAQENQTSFTEACYNGLILTKAFLLESEQSTFDIIKQHGTKEDLALFSTIQFLQEKLRVWERDGRQYADSIVTTTSFISQLESSLSRRCRAYGDVTAFMDIDYASVQHALGENDILLDFTDFVSESRGRVYAVYIVDKHQQYPLLKELFPERSIDSLNVRYPHQFYSGEYAGRMLNLLWGPLSSHIEEGATVYYVPTQMLFQIAPESLPAGDGSLLGDYYHFVRLSSARELLRYVPKLTPASASHRTEAVLYGGLEYSLDGKTMVQEAQKHDVPRMLLFRGVDERLRGDNVFIDLPGTKEEINAIAKALKKARRSVLPFAGKEGTEESFLSLDGKAPQIIHLATHGFYYTPDAAQHVDYLRGYTDAMSLSGLILSGGNAAWLGQELPEGVMGGILTAADIARMDLSGAELVVLSACHSGKGEATPEGLYGLQRAFKKAGVKTIVMSLWAESDLVGPEFMKTFYQNLTGKADWDKHKAFDLARSSIREKYSDSPSLWAGYVMLD